MGSLSVQPPSGLARNLTEVFNFLRNNAQHQSHLQVGFLDGGGGGDEDKVRLISLDDDGKRGGPSASFANDGKGAGASSSSRTPPSWVNVLDEINYEMTRIKTRQVSLQEFQQKHLVGLNFNDENTSPEQERIKELTDELTTMFAHARRLIRLLEESETTRTKTFARLRENVVTSLMIALNALLHQFRATQSNYLKQLDKRASNVDSFFAASSSAAPSTHSGGMIFDDFAPTSFSNFSQQSDYSTQPEAEEELSIAQIQQIMQNEHMTKEREKEVVKISKSILELNTLFKDISSLIVDQGTILDRIDYNVEQSAVQIKSAYKSVQKAQTYQKGSRKMQLILILAGIAVFLMLLILLTKF